MKAVVVGAGIAGLVAARQLGLAHLVFYAGWPKAMSAMTVAKNLFANN